MISTQHKFIFIHIPKTGGTSVQSVLLPFSDDRKIIGPKHDGGIDQFEVAGDRTPEKHVSLSHYASIVIDLSDYHIAATVRNPIDRLLSLYFSPSRWMKKGDDGIWRRGVPYWDQSYFLSILKNFRPMKDFLNVNGKTIVPDSLMRFDDLQRSFRDFARAVDLPHDLSLPRVNVSDAQFEELNKAKHDPCFLDAAYTLFKEDFEFFGFPL